MTDITYALRLLRRSHLFTITVVLTVAIGISATTTIFSVVNAVLLRPLPFADPDRLVQVAEKNDKAHLPAFTASALNYLSWKEETQTFEQLGAVRFATFTLTGQGDPETYSGSAITASLIPLLGIRPLLGRAFVEGEDRPGAPPVALISEGLWKRRFGADPAVVGRTIVLNGTACTLAGIAPPALALLTNGDVWIPLAIDPPTEIRLNHVLFVVGRPKRGVTMHEAQAEMDAIATRVGQQYPEVRDWGINLITFKDTFVSAQLRTALYVLLGAVLFVLAIVSANVANLLLARARDRQREMAVRAALGASQGRLLRQLLIESVVLSSIGGAAGLAGAVWAIDWISASLPPNALPVPDIGIDQTVVLFSVGVTLVAGIAFGLAPAWHGARQDVNSALKDAGRSSTGGARPLFRRALASIELALATVLLIGAALLVQSLITLQRVPLGFNPSNVISFQISLPPTKYDAVPRAAFFHQLGTELKALPGVRAAGISSGIPFGVGNYTTSPITAPGRSVLPPGTPVSFDWRIVSPGFFDTLRIPLLRGRDFADSDTAGAPQVVIVSRAAARMLWGADDPIGRTIRRPADGKEFTVVGVVGDVRSTTLNQESAALYYSSMARTWPLMDVVVRPAGDAATVMAAIRRTVRGLDAEVALANVRPMTDWVLASAAQPRLDATLLAFFACVALLVAAIGTYGVLAYSVSQRTKELGLRMALGADRAGVLRLVLREGMTMAAAGILAGAAAAAALMRVLSALVFGISVRDPWTYAGISTGLALVALFSCLVPAVRASRVDPIHSLRLD